MIKIGEVQDALEKRKSKKPINKSNGFLVVRLAMQNSLKGIDFVSTVVKD